MNVREAYKFGFLLKCALDGLNPRETLERIKQAALLKTAGAGELVTKPVELAMQAPAALTQGAENVTDILKNLWPFAKGTMFHSTISAPVLGGLAGGYGLAQLSDTAISPADAKQEELIAEYRRALDTLSRRRA